jgi:hypothetical protein
MSRCGNCCDNAVMEAFFSSVKSELADRFASCGDAKYTDKRFSTSKKRVKGAHFRNSRVRHRQMPALEYFAKAAELRETSHRVDDDEVSATSLIHSFHDGSRSLDGSAATTTSTSRWPCAAHADDMLARRLSCRDQLALSDRARRGTTIRCWRSARAQRNAVATAFMASCVRISY